MRRLLALSLAALIASTAPAAMAIEEPAYDTVLQRGDFELRRYQPYLVAEVRVAGDFDDAGSRGFRLLANYIFGGNRAQQKMAMTAPVIQQPAQPVKLEMTAPVTQSATAEGWRVQFVLPAGVTPDTAPVPDDDRVTVRQEPARDVAVIRFSGRWTDAVFAQQLQRLRDAARAEGVALRGEAVVSRFNGPWTPPFLRRNEIWMDVER